MMKGLVVVLTLALVASKIVPLCGLAMETLVVHVGRCRCLTESLFYVNPKWVGSIQVIPRGLRCRRTEVILSLKNGGKFCVPPKTKWVANLIKNLTKRFITQESF